VQIIWSQNAITQLVSIRDYIADENPSAAFSVAAKILEAGNTLEVFPNRGRPNQMTDIRELVIVGTPYILVYRAKENEVEILTVWHSAQDRD